MCQSSNCNCGCDKSPSSGDCNSERFKSAAIGAGAGAAIGTAILPGVGTLIGAVVGAAYGDDVAQKSRHCNIK